jgi:hypothetical protein
MRSMRQRLAAVTLIGGLTTLGIGLSAGPASAVQVSDCIPFVGSAQSGSLHITSTPAAGSTVAAGSDLNLKATWSQADWDETDRFLVCGSVNGAFNAAMSGFDLGVNNDGTMPLSATVPASVPAGSNVCVLAVLKGSVSTHTQGTMVSDTLCYTSAAAVITTTSTTTSTTSTTVAPRTVEPTVDPVNTEAGTPSAPAVEAAPAVGGEVAQTPAPLPQLPRTGRGIDVLAGFGIVALALGSLTRLLGRKRSAEA